MIVKNDLRLDRTFDLQGHPDFEFVLVEELLRDTSSLPLGPFCVNGGVPDDDSIDLRIDSYSLRRDEMVVKLTCFFTEVTSTGCSTLKFDESGTGSFELFIDFVGHRAYTETERY